MNKKEKKIEILLKRKKEKSNNNIKKCKKIIENYSEEMNVKNNR